MTRERILVLVNKGRTPGKAKRSFDALETAGTAQKSSNLPTATSRLIWPASWKVSTSRPFVKSNGWSFPQATQAPEKVSDCSAAT
jgi:hypothetical protein